LKKGFFVRVLGIIFEVRKNNVDSENKKRERKG
jgi:hypothetical protein